MIHVGGRGEKLPKLECPNCKQTISFFHFFKAFSPWNFKCASCNKKIRPNKASMTIFLAFMILAALFGWFRRSLNLSWPNFLVLGIILAGIAEYAMYRVYVKFGATTD